MKVQVLISVYNSVRFFPEQLDTVLNQKDVEVSILIRDDGSKNPDMEAIIRQYQENYPGVITYYSGENIGPAASFMELIKKADESSDYYAFCDHDDLWDEDKLQSAVALLQQLDNSQPNCCFCNYRLCNASGNIIGVSNLSPEQKFSVRNLLLSNPAPGCCIVFNKEVKKLVDERPIPRVMIMHDGWIILMCAMLGQVEFDGNAHISYRQHGRNAVGVATTRLQRIRFKINYIMRKSNKNSHGRVFREFVHLYGKLIQDPERRKIIKLLCEYGQNFFKRLKLFLSPNVVTYNRKLTLFFKTLVLVNRW